MPRDDRPYPVPNMFVAALRGIALGVRREFSFAVHIPATIAVIALAIWLRVNAIESAVLALCVAAVWSAELFNTSIEHLARAVDERENPQLRDALDIAAGAVLVVALGAVAVGGIIFGTRIFGG